MTAEPPTATRPPIERLVEMEPRLAALLAEARGTRPEPGVPFCAGVVWYGPTGLAKELARILGPRRVPEWQGADDPELYRIEAHDAAEAALYASLPDCEPGCFCSGPPPRFPLPSKRTT